MMPLTMVNTGETNYIKKISGKDDVKRHLNNLGLVEGEKVTVVSKMNGNVILGVKDSRIAIDKMLANRIIV